MFLKYFMSQLGLKVCFIVHIISSTLTHFLIVIFFLYMYAKSILSTSLIKLFYKRMELRITLYTIITYKTKFEDWKYTSNRQPFHVVCHPSSL